MASKKQTLLAFVFLLFAPQSYTQQDKLFFRNDYTYIKETQSFYKMHTMRKNFDDAMNVCHSESARLFYPRDENEMKAVTEWWERTQKPVWYVGIGVASFIIPGLFESIDGQPLTDLYNNWAPGEPNNAGNEQCVEIKQDRNLNDVDCSHSRPFICRKTLAALYWNYPCDLPNLEYKLENSLGKCYKFHLDPKTWQEAYAICSAEQSYLTVINSKKEADVLVRITADALKDKTEDVTLEAVHLGFRKTFQGWLTVKGTKLQNTGYSKWADGQPDNAGGAELCGSMFYNGQLNDVNCTQSLQFICEHDLKSSKTR